MAFAALINVANLTATDGFRIGGGAANDRVGYSVSLAGDFNGDGFDDLLISSAYVDANGADSGAAYVVFGGTSLTSFSLSAINGTNGFILTGSGNGAFSGSPSEYIGDINNDGFDDIAFTSYAADTNGTDSGAVYVIFGTATPFGASLNPTTMSASQGFRINGSAAAEKLGFWTNGVGDFNGDGIDDFAVSTLGNTVGGAGAGANYLIYGHTGAFSNFVATALTGPDGFRATGQAGENFGRWVDGIGDVDNDGKQDFAVAASLADPNSRTDAGIVYVTLGRAANATASFSTSTFAATGFRVIAAPNDRVGSVSGAGDVNGDGFDDFIVGGANSYIGGAGATSGIAYVIFGRSGLLGSTIDVATLSGTTGFRITGTSSGDQLGYYVSSAGDINDDGFDDVIVGARFGDNNGAGSTGEAYVIFGKASGWAVSIGANTLNGTNGFRLRGGAASDTFGRAVGAGDINGDGVSDIVVGAETAATTAAGTGAVYVVYGQPRVRNITGGVGDESIAGGFLADTLGGGGGKDSINGMQGDDLIDGGDGNDVLLGGLGLDDVVGGVGNDYIDGGDGNDELFGGLGADKLIGGEGVDLLRGEDGADRLEGGAGADDLLGGLGNDYLDGGAGADVMAGGADNDIYIVDNALDQTIEIAGAGYDIVRTALSWTLSDNIEGLELQGTGDIDGTGNAEANTLVGNDGANVLSGLGGVDTVNGGAGADTIVGGLGNDILKGGGGADTFVVHVESLGLAVMENDTVQDFVAGLDRIDLSSIDANGAADGDGAFALVSTFTKVAGQMTLSFAAGTTSLRLDLNGDGKADYQMKINGDVTGASGGWSL